MALLIESDKLYNVNLWRIDSASYVVPFALNLIVVIDVFLALLIISVVETKDGTVSVATAFAGHQEGNASAHNILLGSV